MSRRRAKSAGWAAFDLQQKHKDVLETQGSNDAFPSLPATATMENFSRKNGTTVKPLSSVKLPYMDYTTTVGNKKCSKLSEVGSSDVPLRSDCIIQENKFGQARQLKELYRWADDSLIEVVLAAAGNDFDKASSFFKAMVSEESLGKSKVANSSSHVMEPGKNNIHGKQDVPLRKVFESSKTYSVVGSCIGGDGGNVRDEFDLHTEKLFDGCTDINGMLSRLSCIPIEPEWEEDDVYLNCRKDAIKLMRAVTRYSKAATDAYLRGDHFSAQQFSLKAREERVAAERLNEEAAREILRIRNENNGIWRLDLHGLHAAEALKALQERLHMIETQAFFKGSNPLVFPNSVRTKTVALHTSSLGDRNHVERSDEQTISGPRSIWLEVITGIGKHSRGKAALPSAVRTFLVDNGYRFDEARPGMIMVRPKVRHTGTV